jgi:hypothetical protein
LTMTGSPFLLLPHIPTDVLMVIVHVVSWIRHATFLELQDQEGKWDCH